MRHRALAGTVTIALLIPAIHQVRALEHRRQCPPCGNPPAVTAHGVLKQRAQCVAVMVAEVLRLWSQ
jgi:hypothetical protein